MMNSSNPTPDCNPEPDYDINLDPGVMRTKDYYEMSNAEHVLWEQEIDRKYDEVQVQNEENAESLDNESQFSHDNILEDTPQSSGFSVLESLLNIIKDFNRQLYFIHDGEGNGNLEAHFSYPDKNEWLHIKSGEKLESIMHEFQPPFDLPDRINLEWLHLCLNMLSDASRLEFYNNLNVWIGSFSSDTLIELIRKNQDKPNLVKELISFLPTTMVMANRKEVEQMIHFLEVELKADYPDILNDYLYEKRMAFNKSTEQMILLNAIKDYVPQKLTSLEYLDVVKRYNNLAQEPVFTTPAKVRHIHLQVDYVKIYQYLGLKDSKQSEINIWSENLITNLFRKPEIKLDWGLMYYLRNNASGHLQEWVITVEEQSKLDEKLFIESVNQLLLHIRMINPESIFTIELDSNQWLTKYWFKYKLEESLPGKNSELESGNERILTKI